MAIDAGQIFYTTEIFAPKYNSNYQIVAAPGTYAADWQYDIQLTPNSQPAHWEELYPRPNSPWPEKMTRRDHAGVTRLFDGFGLVEPGVTRTSKWRPDSEVEAASPAALWAGVARKA